MPDADRFIRQQELVPRDAITDVMHGLELRKVVGKVPHLGVIIEFNDHG